MNGRLKEQSSAATGRRWGKMQRFHDGAERLGMSKPATRNEKQSKGYYPKAEAILQRNTGRKRTLANDTTKRKALAKQIMGHHQGKSLTASPVDDGGKHLRREPATSSGKTNEHEQDTPKTRWTRNRHSIC
jgi:hypothetical protein